MNNAKFLPQSKKKVKSLQK